MGTVGFQFARRFDLNFSAGGIIEGEIFHSNFKHQLVPGWLASAQFGILALKENRAIPFLRFSVAASFSNSGVKNDGNIESLIASDVRLGMTVGYTLLSRWQVYLAPKVFGGPVFWDRADGRIQGRDRYFFQAAMGSSLRLPGEVSIFVEGSAFGEQMISTGLTWVF